MANVASAIRRALVLSFCVSNSSEYVDVTDIRVFAFAQSLNISPGRFVGRYATDDALKVNIGVLEGCVQVLEFVEVITHSGSQVLFAVYTFVGDDRANREFYEFCALVECFANFIGW